MINKPATLRTIAIAVVIFTCSISCFSQKKIYTYYMNDKMELVPREQASIIGKGAREDSIFTLRIYTLADNRLLAIQTFKDSTLSVLHGSHIGYHTNRKPAETAYYKNNMLHGPSVKRDTLGRVTDSAMYYEDIPVYLVKYLLAADGSVQKVYEFDNGYATRRLTEKDIVITENGVPVNYTIWQNLLYNGRYAFKQDKINDNRFLIFKFNEDYYNQILERDPPPKESSFFKTGQDFSLNEVDIDGNRLRSKDLKGKVLVINYWFINCKPCRMEMPELNELVAAYKDSVNVKFIGIALDDRNAIKDFIKLSPFHYQLVANGQTSAQKYGITAYPTHVIVDGDGKVRFHTVSSPRQLFYRMRKTINQLQEEQRKKPAT